MNAGNASSMFAKSICFISFIINRPTITSAGAVAYFGTIPTRGTNSNATKKQTPVTNFFSHGCLLFGGVAVRTSCRNCAEVRNGAGACDGGPVYDERNKTDRFCKHGRGISCIHYNGDDSFKL